MLRVLEAHQHGDKVEQGPPVAVRTKLVTTFRRLHVSLRMPLATNSGLLQCFCGFSADVPDSLGSGQCGYDCSGDPVEDCGGFNAISVYEYTSP